MDPAWIVAAVSLATLLVGFFTWVLRKMFRLMRLIVRFTDDYFGEPASPGRAERPGVMTRLERVEVVAKSISDQVHTNSGHSLKDCVTRTEGNVKDLQISVRILSERLEKLAGGNP